MRARRAHCGAFAQATQMARNEITAADINQTLFTSDPLDHAPDNYYS